MTDNNHNLHCDFNDELVSYFYGEIDFSDRAKFDKHLDVCSSCVEELKSFGRVQSAIGVWREEFSQMQTPKIEIPYGESQKALEVSGKSVSKTWLEASRKFFSTAPTWATATAGFSIVAVCLCLTFFALRPSKSDEVSGLVKPIQSNEIKVAESPSEPSVNGNGAVAVDDNNDSEIAAVDDDSERVSAVEETPEKIVSPVQKDVSAAKRIVNDSSKVLKSDVPSRTFKRSNENDFEKSVGLKNVEAKSKGTEIRDVPKLFNSATEEEDNSLRLADLFDEVGS